MLIRVRTNVGVWRIDGLDESSATIEDIMSGIQKQRPHVEFEKVRNTIKIKIKIKIKWKWNLK